MMFTRNTVFVIFVVYVQGCVSLLNDAESMNDRLLALEGKFQSMLSRINNLETSSKGTTYFRWGRQTCQTNGTELVYAGIAGGGYYSHTGAPADYVCLPHDPNLLTNLVSHSYITHIYGAEYEDNLFGANLANRDVPCAVCHTTRKSSTIMIPGRNHCHDGWSMEYHGQLASGFQEELAASQYVCVDSSPEAFEHTTANEDGKLFYPVRAGCGSLPCPPYVNNAFLTCVVCSK